MIAFWLLYLNLSQSDPSNLSEPHGRASAFYFTVTMVSMVRFVARASRARCATVSAYV